MKMLGLTHRLSMIAAALWVASACGGEVRSQSEIPEGGSPIVEIPAAERPTLIGRDDATLDGLLHGQDANERLRRAQEERAAAEEEYALQSVREPTPLPRYTTRSEPEPAADETRAAEEPRLAGTDGDGQIVEVQPAPDFGEAADSEFEIEPSPRPANELEPLEVPAGEELRLSVDSELSTERNQPGDYFYATLVDDVLATDGLVLLAQGTRVRGVVTESTPSESSDVLPVLDFVVDAIMLDEGEQPIETVVTYADLSVDERDSGEETAVKVITGAAAGAILGRILGDDKKDAVKGGVAGAAAGAAVALGTRGGHARLEPGSRIVVRLERPLLIVE